MQLAGEEDAQHHAAPTVTTAGLVRGDIRDKNLLIFGTLLAFVVGPMLLIRMEAVKESLPNWLRPWGKRIAIVVLVLCAVFVLAAGFGLVPNSQAVSWSLWETGYPYRGHERAGRRRRNRHAPLGKPGSSGLSALRSYRRR